jgi:hypothetical protein
MHKPKILQSYSRGEADDIKELDVDYTVSSDDFVPGLITKATGISPTESWSKGERFYRNVPCPATGEVKRHWAKRFTGLWRVSSKQKIEALYVNDHISYLLNVIEPASEYFKQLCKKEGYRVSFCVYRAQYDYQGTFVISADNMRRMAKLCHEIHFLCPTFENDKSEQ